MEIKITDNLSISYGNFGFILEKSGHEKLQNRCITLERYLKSDYDSFAINYRLVLEEFAISEEVRKRIINSGMRFNEQTTRDRITQEVKRNQTGYSDLLIDLCLNSENADLIENLMKKQRASTDNWDSSVFKEELQKYIRMMFRFASKNAHSGEKSSDLIPTNDVCRDYFRKLFYLLCAYYGHSAKFDGSLLPFGDYYPIPKSQREQLGIILENKKQIYVKQGEKSLEFYLFVPADEHLADAQKRDIETVHKLWMDNIDSPQNIVNHPTFISNKNNKDYRYWVYPLPTIPHSMTDEYLKHLSYDEKMEIIRGIVRGVASMHHAEPPFYHRSLSTAAFLICKIRNRLKPLLINFDCVKDTDEFAEYTVFYAVSDKLSEEELREAFAPELYSEELDSDKIDWAKVDIYALGKMIVKIFTNSYDVSTENLENIGKEQSEMIISMCNEDFSCRPDINEVLRVF
ncbi:MAG: hypothetical protein E7536_06265 [Ruminococcaceae bacterium]|nr:hypothetical protein [Oscillospiraceae bacterium]